MVEEDKISKDIEFPKISLNKSQEYLLSSLKSRSKSCSKMYSDILKLIDLNFLDSKSHLIGHLMRELDSEIRSTLEYKDPDILSDGQKKEIKDEIIRLFTLKGFSVEGINFKGISDSICKILNLNEEYGLIKEWISIGYLFHKIAHRDGNKFDTRPFSMFIDIWEKYELILTQVLGSPYALLGILDKQSTQKEPTKEQIAILNNQLKVPNYQNYFYSVLKQADWLKVLNEADFFNPTNNPKPRPAEDGNGYYIISWSVFSYLEWISINSTSEDIIKELVSIIDNIIDYKEEGKRINNFRTDFSIYKILTNIPSKFVTKNHIKFIKESLEMHFHSSMISAELSRGFITKLISDDNKDILLELVNVACSYVKINSDIESLMESYWFTELIKVHKEELSKYAPKEISEIVINKIEEIKKEDLHSFNIAWIPTIEAHEQKSFPERYEAQLIDLLVECLKNLSDEGLVGKTSVLLKSEIDILKRIGFYLVGFKFDILKDLLFSLDYNPLEDFSTKHELYELLKSNATLFSDDQFDMIVKWIEEKEYHLDGVKEEEKESVLAYRKKEWYLALKESKNKTVQENYTNYDAINDAKPEHPGFVSWSTTWMGDATPMEEFQIENSSVDELIKRMTDFKEEKGFRKPSVRGFADEIQKDVEKQPSKYSKSLDKFKEVNLAYICSILRGFINLGTKNINDHKIIVELDWEKILTFVNEFINDDFWKADHTGEFNYKEWFVAEVARLIEAGTKQDETAFDVKLLPVAKEILLKLTKHDFFYESNPEDHVSFTLNSTEGKILDAMLNYSLRVFRKVDKKFDEDIKKHFEERMSDKKYLEVFTTLGQYLPNFNALDKEWVNSNFDVIFPKENEKILDASISGLFFNSIVYADFYKPLKEKGIYKKLLDSWATNRRGLNESLLRHICLGYAEKWEELEDNTLIKDLLSKYDSLDEVVRFFWIIAKNIKPEYKPRVKALWKYIVEKNPDTPITGKIMEWLNIFDELDNDLIALCMSGAKYIDGHHVHYVVEYLIKFIDTKYEEVGKILLEMVSNINIVSDYKKEDVIKIVKYLYDNNKKQLADDICNQYFNKHDLLFLREIYNKNNSSVEKGNQND